MEHAKEAGSAVAAKVAPPVTVIGAEAVGVHVAEWIQYVTLVYISLLVIHKAWHMWKEWKTGRAMPDTPEEMP